jgi:BlaI family penicillinase repressor
VLSLNELPTPTPRELEILKVLWAQGASSVRGVYEQISEQEPDLAFNTVQTLLRIMEGKKLVRHEQRGRTFIYTPLFSREETTVRFLDRVFDGAVAPLVQSLLERERVSAVELEALAAMITEARQKELKRKDTRKGRAP